MEHGTAVESWMSWRQLLAINSVIIIIFSPQNRQPSIWFYAQSEMWGSYLSDVTIYLIHHHDVLPPFMFNLLRPQGLAHSKTFCSLGQCRSSGRCHKPAHATHDTMLWALQNLCAKSVYRWKSWRPKQSTEKHQQSKDVKNERLKSRHHKLPPFMRIQPANHLSVMLWTWAL